MDPEDGLSDSVDDEGFIAIANELLDKCNLPDKVSRLEDCNDNFFVEVYRSLLGDDLPGIIENPISVEQRIQNCQIVVDLVATDVLNVDLSHISGKGIVQGEKVSIRNFLEIFAGLLEYFMECVEDEASDDENDSNLLTSEHDIVSGVLREEFGASYQPLYGPRERHLREKTKDPSRSGGDNRSRSLTRAAATDSILTNSGNSSGFDADTSKLSDSRVGALSDSTAELIRLAHTGTDRGSLTESKRKDTTDHLSDSMSGMSVPSVLSPVSSSIFNSDDVGGDTNNRRSIKGSATAIPAIPSSASHLKAASSQISSRDIARKPESSLLGPDATSPEEELTQYTLTPTEPGDFSAGVKKGSPEKPASSFLSGSSTSAAWPEQISPLEPSKESISGRPGEFDALGVRPKSSSTTGVTDVEARDNSGRSTPVYRHYHHHFHHTQPQGRVSDFQSAAEVSAAAGVDVVGQTSGMTRSEPSSAVTMTAGLQKSRLIQTAPSALTFPHVAALHPSVVIPRSTVVSSAGLTQPTPAGVTGTTSTLTDSVFLSSSASSRRPVMRPSTANVTSGAFVSTSLRDKIAQPTTATSSAGSSLPASSSSQSSPSYRPYLATGRGLDERASVIERANKLAERLNSLRTGQSLASTFPGRSSVTERQQTRATTLEETRLKADESGSDSERDPEVEELAQNSDSAVDYGRISSVDATSPPTSRQGRSRKTPRTPRSYKESTDGESSPERRPRRGVTFRDTVETFPVSGRMDRLRRLLHEEAEEQRKRHMKDMRRTYRDQLKEIQRGQEREMASHQKRKIPLSPGVARKKPKKKSPVKKSGRLQAVYRSQLGKYRPLRKTPAAGKERKRSASASPVRSKRSSNSPAPDHPDLLLPGMLDEFPFLHVSPQTAHSMWQKQARHLSSVLKTASEGKRTKTHRMIEEAERRQEALVGILKKDLDHNLRMREKQEQQQQQRTVRAKLREKRQVSARARRYYDEYEQRMRARMLKRRTREEQIFKRLFQDGLEIQKQRIRELREYAKEKREALAQRQQNEIESLENFYRDQFAMLAEGIARERFEVEVREKAQEKVVRQMRSELRSKLEREVKGFQENLQRDEDSAYFRQLEADRLRGKLQLATRSVFY